MLFRSVATLGSFFYENALSFNVADSPSLAAVINEYIEFGQHHLGRRYKAPKQRRISGQLLESAYEATTVSVHPIISCRTNQRVQHCARSLLRHLAQGRDCDVDVDQASPDGTGPTGRVPSRPATGAAQAAVTGSDRQL